MLNAVDTTVSLDFDGNMLATGVNSHDVDRPNGSRIFTAHERRPLTDAFDLFSQVFLQMVFDAIFDQSWIFAQIVRFIGINML